MSTPNGNQQAPGQGSDAGETPTGDPGQGQQDQQPATFDTWLAGQDEPTKKLLTDHTAGLASALKSERTERGKLEKQLREISGKLEEGSEARGKLDTLAGQLADAEQRAQFYEDAAAAKVKAPKLAYLAAKDAGLIDEKSGKADLGKLREQFPELFEAAEQRRNPPGNAGAGTAAKPPAAKSMNDIIRKAAGR